ncbi:MAG: IclR family transcriptional regulator [Actinomycetes bacterium]
MPSAHGTQAVDRAAQLLVRVVETDQPQTFSALCAELQLPRSTTSRLLGALERHGLIERDPTGAFRAGGVFAGYAQRAGAPNDLSAMARPVLERLGELTGETVNLAVPRVDRVEQIDQVDSRYLLGATNWVGIQVPLHASALGKVFLAHGASALPSGRLERRTSATITSRLLLEAQLVEVRQRGYAVTREELEPGLVAIAAPVTRGDRGVVAAISVSGPTARMGSAQIGRVGRLLVDHTRTLSDRLEVSSPTPDPVDQRQGTEGRPSRAAHHRMPPRSRKEGAA